MVKLHLTKSEVEQFLRAGDGAEVVIGRPADVEARHIFELHGRLWCTEMYGYAPDGSVVYKVGHIGEKHPFWHIQSSMTYGMHRFEVEVVGYIEDRADRAASAVIDTKKMGRGVVAVAKVKIICRNICN